MSTVAVKEISLVVTAFEAAGLAAGRISQIRRVIKKQPKPSEHTEGQWMQFAGRRRGCLTWDTNARFEEITDTKTGDVTTREYFMPVAEWMAERSPWKPGDVLLCKESWAIEDCGSRVKIVAGDLTMKHRLRYPATDKSPAKDNNGRPVWWNKRSSQAMPPWAIRSKREVVAVRAERLQDATEVDAVAMGFPFRSGCECNRKSRLAHCRIHGGPGFESHWCLNHGCDSWDQNLWVWVADLRTPTEGARQ